jgi:hypothetical protein
MKLMLIVIGPESTATRAFTKAFSHHPEILGTSQANQHVDVLDVVWQHIENGEIFEAKEYVNQHIKKHVVVTRRSVPHSIAVGKPADYLSFPSLKTFIQLCQDTDYHPFLLITARNPIANLYSSAMQRASSKNNVGKALNQYFNAYNQIFELTREYDIPFFIISPEMFILDQDLLIQSLHEFFGLKSIPLKLEIKPKINKKYLQAYVSNIDKTNFKSLLNKDDCVKTVQETKNVIDAIKNNNSNSSFINLVRKVFKKFSLFRLLK